MPHVLFVCTANICRSPVAEGYFRQKAQSLGLTDMVTSSAGTWAERVRPASRYSVEVLAEKGIDIKAHRARMIDRAMLAEADLVLTMESGHAEALRVEFGDQASKIYLLSQMVGPTYDISDPYGGPRHEYEIMIRDVTKLIDDGWDRLIGLATNPQ